jgi:hypothetical protein
VSFEFLPGPELTCAHLNCPICNSVQAPTKDFEFSNCAKCRRLLYSHYSVIIRLILGRWKLSIDCVDYELRLWLIVGTLSTFFLSSLIRIGPALGLYMFATTESIGGATYIIEAMAIFTSGIARGSLGIHLGWKARRRGIAALFLGFLICACGVVTLDLSARFVAAAAPEKARR